jgi:hypothetical protein
LISIKVDIVLNMATTPKKNCLNCGEVVTTKGRFCSSECSEDYENNLESDGDDEDFFEDENGFIQAPDIY